MTPKPVIFLVYANDRDDQVRYLRNLPDEARRLRRQLEAAELQGLCELVERFNATAADVFRVFQSAEYRNRVAIFHYAGHANGYSLLFESDVGQAAAADASSLARFLGQQTGLRLVFLNGCSTRQQVDDLLAAGVPAVIATSRAIDDGVATEFSECFYRGLTGGADINTSFQESEAVALTTRGGNTRALYIGGEKLESAMELTADRCPWELYFRAGSEIAAQWNLPEAVNDPLFGLPALPFQHLPPSPFRNLEWFGRKHADVFFGRESEIRELYTKVTNPQTPPVIFYYGQSGVGKSSLLDAGLLPRLESKYDVIYRRREPENGMDWEINELLQHRKNATQPYTIVADQIEEIFTRPNPNRPDEFANLLRVIDEQHSAAGNGKIILVFRKEWLAEIEDQAAAREIPFAKVFLDRLDRAGVMRAISGPSRSQRCRDHYHLTVEQGLPEIIADDLLEDRNTSVAPTLQVLLTRMWNAAKQLNEHQPEFTIDLYQSMRRQGILLDDFLRMQVDKIRDNMPGAVESGLLYDLLLRHTTALGTAESCRDDDLRRLYPHVAQDIWALRQLCLDHFMLIVPERINPNETPGTRLSHDSLAPVVRQVVGSSELPGQRGRRCLEARIREWRTLEPKPALDAASLELISAGRNGTAAWTDEEKQFIAYSQKKIAADRPEPLAAALIPTELKLKRFVPDECLEAVTADVGHQPLTFIESSPLRVILLSFAIVLVTLGLVAQFVVGFVIAAGLETALGGVGGFGIPEFLKDSQKLIEDRTTGGGQSWLEELIFLGLTGLNVIAWFAFYMRLGVRFDLRDKKAHMLSRLGNISAPVESLKFWHERNKTLNEVITVDDCVLVRRPLVDGQPKNDQLIRFYRALCNGVGRQPDFGTKFQVADDGKRIKVDEATILPQPRLLSGLSLLAIYLSIAAFSFVLGPVALAYGLVLLILFAMGRFREWSPAAMCAFSGALTTSKLVFINLPIPLMIPFLIIWLIWIRQIIFDYALSPLSPRQTVMGRIWNWVRRLFWRDNLSSAN